MNRKLKSYIVVFVILLTVFGLSSCKSDVDDTKKGQNDSKSADTVNVGSSINLDGSSYEWQVLAVEDDKMLVITKDIIELRAYNEEDAETTWETCSLRKWLNEDFLEGFDENLQARVLETTLKNEDNPYYDTPAGVDTKDKIFLLSLDEAEQYFETDKERIGYYYPTDEQIRNVAERVIGNPLYDFETADAAEASLRGFILSSPEFIWWLRSPGDNNRRAACVYWDGSLLGYDEKIGSGSLVNDVAKGVRPAMWIRVE